MKQSTYVYFRIPSNFEVQMITVLSAAPDAKRLPRECYGSSHKFIATGKSKAHRKAMTLFTIS